MVRSRNNIFHEGGILSDDIGNPLIAYSKCYGYGTKTRREALALLDGLKICQDLGLPIDIVEADSTLVWNTWIMSRIQELIPSRNSEDEHKAKMKNTKKNCS
ncbi:unnamed protein product [Dovyalis caffra]|uniref:RNase H type-1 domain-containing protein n=1 Tax=Dovyalis caffra TaxID=77055 RepID=A0AAV1RVE7_9ROSI|nr:unnamed protein product [Dovyalis caffra]